jgi:hypothetical protein
MARVARKAGAHNIARRWLLCTPRDRDYI